MWHILLIIITTFSFTALHDSANAQSTTAVAGIELNELRDSGYKIDWINQTTIKGLRLPTISNESFYAVDQEDYLARFDLNTGKWIWSAPVGNEVFELHSISEFLSEGIVYVLSDSAIYPVEIATGNYPTVEHSNDVSISVQHVPLKWVASTPAVIHGNTIVYGSSNGDAVWVNPSIGYVESRYQTGSSIHVTPSLVQGIRDKHGLKRYAIISAATDGKVTAVDASHVRKLWDIKLLDGVEAPITYAINPTVVEDELPDTFVYIAGTDQYLRAIDLESGLTKWKVLTTAPLVDSPVIVKNILYQQVPGSGLHSFKAFPTSISGDLNWTAENVLGNVITTNHNGHIICWDSQKRLIQVLDPRSGGVISTISLPSVRSLVTDDINHGSLYLITNDDMLLRLSPRR